MKILADEGIGELIFRQRRAPAGVLLLRLAGLSAHTKAELVTATLSDHAQELAGAFSVLAPGQLRLRRSSDDESG